jgi:hypothetical protein
MQTQTQTMGSMSLSKKIKSQSLLESKHIESPVRRGGSSVVTDDDEYEHKDEVKHDYEDAYEDNTVLFKTPSNIMNKKQEEAATQWTDNDFASAFLF